MRAAAGACIITMTSLEASVCRTAAATAAAVLYSEAPDLAVQYTYRHGHA